MGLLLLLTSTLLYSYLYPGRVVSAMQSFTMKNIILSIEPSTNVTRDTNVTLRCKAIIASSLDQEALSREYTIYKDRDIVYKTSSTSEDLLYPLPKVRVSNSGKYRCTITIEDKQLTSEAKKLTVAGLSKPVLRLNKDVVNEGDELTAMCEAPGETGFIYFYFYDDSKEIVDKQVNSNQAEAKLRLSSVGIHTIHCAYIVFISPNSFKSVESNTVTVSVKELSITTVLEIDPHYKVYEGDTLHISCTSSNFLHHSENVSLYLSQGTKLLHSGNTTKVNYSMVAQSNDPGEFECKVEIGNVVRVVTKTVSVTELFSAPTLTMSPAEVFRNENMQLTCKSERYASERLSKEELIYTLDPPQWLLTPRDNGVFSVKALQYDFNYTCVAKAKGIVKHSETLTVRPKVFVSIPKISVVGRAVLGQPFKILCQSDNGSLPINYTLLNAYDPLSTVTVKLPFQQALFTVTITKTDEINMYMCEAKNNHKRAIRSKTLNATVIEPLTDPYLISTTKLSEIFEGQELYLICSIKGTPPVTFKWYREGSEQPLHTTTSNENNTPYRFPMLSKEHSGKYYCEAINYANNVVRSDRVNVEVRMAVWKKAVIGGFSFLAVSVLVVVCVLCFRTKRGKREAPAELSVKPSSPKSDDSLTMNLTHDTEVYNTTTVRVDRAAVSVWSKRPSESDAANDEESSEVSNEPDVEYTEVVHHRPVDHAKVPLRKGTDTVYSELQNSPHGAADHHDYGSIEYAELNGEQPEINHYHPEVNNYQDLPEPVD